jgi:hypothetical protein
MSHITTSPSRFARRAFVRATGIGVGCLPLLTADRPARAAAPKRLILIAWPNGVRSADWWPDAKKGSIDFSEGTGHGVTETNFSFAGLKMIEPLEPHRQDLLLFRGVRLAAGGPGHESQPHLFSVGGGQTLDQHVGAKQATPWKTLNLSVQKRDRRGHIYRGGPARSTSASRARTTPTRTERTTYTRACSGGSWASSPTSSTS